MNRPWSHSLTSYSTSCSEGAWSPSEPTTSNIQHDTRLGRPHWFFRVLAITAIPTLLLLVRAYEPCRVFLVQSGVTVVPLVIVRNIRGWEPFGRPTMLPARRAAYARFQVSSCIARKDRQPNLRRCAASGRNCPFDACWG